MIFEVYYNGKLLGCANDIAGINTIIFHTVGDDAEVVIIDLLFDTAYHQKGLIYDNSEIKTKFNSLIKAYNDMF